MTEPFRDSEAVSLLADRTEQSFAQLEILDNALEKRNPVILSQILLTHSREHLEKITGGPIDHIEQFIKGV
ncbi:MAG: hypothetical protein M3Q79_03900 [bacterium]|nr:hypothetical protein [bacterium]